MCLIRVYMEKGDGRELIAEDIAFVIKDGDKIILRSLEFKDVSTLEDADISLMDTLNSTMTIKSQL